MKDISVTSLLKGIVLLILGICAIVLLVFVNTQGFSRIETLNKRGDYKILQEEKIPYESVSDFLVADGYLFLLYDQAGLVNIYSVDGKFQYGIQVYTSTGGRSNIVYSGERLYIQARLNVIYVFEGSNCVRCLDLKNDRIRQEYMELKNVFETVNGTTWDGYHYALAPRRSGVSRQMDDGLSELIIEFPQLHPSAYIFAMIFIGAFSLLIWLEDK